MSFATCSAEGGGGSEPGGGSTKTQLEESLLPDFLGANGSIGLGEHVAHGHINSPSRRLPVSVDLDFGSAAEGTPSIL